MKLKRIAGAIILTATMTAANYLVLFASLTLTFNQEFFLGMELVAMFMAGIGLVLFD